MEQIFSKWWLDIFEYYSVILSTSILISEMSGYMYLSIYVIWTSVLWQNIFINSVSIRNAYNIGSSKSPIIGLRFSWYPNLERLNTLGRTIKMNDQGRHIIVMLFSSLYRIQAVDIFAFRVFWLNTETIGPILAMLFNRISERISWNCLDRLLIALTLIIPFLSIWVFAQRKRMRF